MIERESKKGLDTRILLLKFPDKILQSNKGLIFPGKNTNEEVKFSKSNFFDEI